VGRPDLGAVTPGNVAVAYYVGLMADTTESLRVEVRRSRRRTRTISAYREKDAIVVLIPARLSAAEEQEWVTTMVERVTKAERRRRRSDDDLVGRAAALSRQYLEGLATPASVRWVDNQRTRWGSCTPADRTIRISDRVRTMPPYVVDYVVLHELAHLLVHGHGAEFWEWVNRYPLTERARGFLDGVSATAQLGIGDEPDDIEAEPPR
jgi:predicted metal-dependent hydrolase